ncbi:MAG: alpha/beta fold hydrolase [Gemmatimonadetes bacterium]|nr:alpha/beta fold hydrolase [Gemmatimonadota bacterium]
MLQSAVRVLAVLAAVYVLLAVLAWRYQERIAFPAPRTRFLAPIDFRIPDGRHIALTTSDGVQLNGWYLPPNPAPPHGARAPGLIWFYGNMETLSTIGGVIREFRPPEVAVVAIDYRGYGESGGSPTEAGLHRDAEAAWEFLAGQSEVDSSRIAVYGRSLGSSVAMHLATSRPVRAVILESPFTSGRDMAAVHYGWLPRFINRLSLDNLTRASRLTVPLLVIHGTDDAIAPIRMGRAVAAAGRGALVELKGSGHNQTYDVGGRLYREKVWSFLAGALGEKREKGKEKGEK